VQAEVVELLAHIVVGAVVIPLEATQHGLHLGERKPVREEGAVQPALGTVEHRPDVRLALGNREVIEERPMGPGVQVPSAFQLLNLPKQLPLNLPRTEPTLRSH
jgi:hypothetical protein